MGTIKEVIMSRDGISAEDADMLIADATEQLQEYLEEDEQDLAYHICQEFFGLEPDYIMELLPY